MTRASCAYVQGPGIARVTVSGALDLASAPQLDDALSEAARGSVAVIVDLSELTFMDSSGRRVGRSPGSPRERSMCAGPSRVVTIAVVGADDAEFRSKERIALARERAQLEAQWRPRHERSPLRV